MPDAPFFPPPTPPISPTDGSSFAMPPVSLTPGLKLPRLLREEGMQRPHPGATLSAFSGGNTISDILENLNGPVALPGGQTVDSETFKVIVLALAIPT